MKYNFKNSHPSDLKIVNSGVKYFGDGSGRDGYVISEYGGTVLNFKSQNSIVKEYSENKKAYLHNRSKSQKAFIGTPTFSKKRPEFNIRPIHKITSIGGVLPEWNNPYPPQVLNTIHMNSMMVRCDS